MPDNLEDSRDMDNQASGHVAAARKLCLGLVQLRAVDSPEDNVRRAVEEIRRAAARGAEVVCLQELFRTRYFCQSQDPGLFDLAESVPGPTTEALAPVARELGVALVVPVFERRAAGVYHNSVVLLDENGVLAGLYRKMHIPHDPLFYEKYYFTPGDLGFQTLRTGRGAALGPLICWDQWFPEAARLNALAGAEVLLYPTAIGWHAGTEPAERGVEIEAWRTMQRAHAIANGVFVAAVNRVGREGELEFWGASFVADPMGTVIAQASGEREETLVVTCDLSAVERCRRLWPFLRDRRVDAYGALTRRYAEP